MSAINFNATAVIEDAFLDLGITAPGESLAAADAQFALRSLNNFVSSLQQHRLAFPLITREVFDTVADTSTYTIGPGGTFNTVRPMGIRGAALLLPSTSATVGAQEIPIAVLTDDDYEAITLKDMQSTMFTAVYYKPTYSGGLGSIRLWPVPNVATYDLVLYRADPIAGFANLTTTYDFPPGYADMLQYNLEKRICRSYGKAREWGPLDDELARESLFLVKRQNSTPAYIALDARMAGSGIYDIVSDSVR